MKTSEAIEYLNDVRNGIHIPAPGIERSLLNDKEKEAIGLAISALEKQEADRWIPCSVRPPELESEVLVTDEYGEIRHADYSDWLGKAEFRTVEESMTLEDVKAWRPLPEAFQGE